MKDSNAIIIKQVLEALEANAFKICKSNSSAIFRTYKLALNDVEKALIQHKILPDSEVF